MATSLSVIVSTSLKAQFEDDQTQPEKTKWAQQQKALSFQENQLPACVTAYCLVNHIPLLW